MSCNRCKKTLTGPLNFLLSCSECKKRWHHRCHIPPLSDPELTALIRATNNNDIDNGLSSWIGRCCKRKRVQAGTIPETVSSRPAETPNPQTHSVSAAPASNRQVSQKPDLSSVPTQSTHRDDQTRNTISLDGVATPPKHDGRHTTRDLGFPNQQTPTKPQMTILVRPAVQYPTTVSLDIAAAQPERSRTMPPLPSTSYTASSSGNVTSTPIPDTRPAHLREISLPLVRTPPGQPTAPTYVQAHSRSFKRTSASGSVGPDLANSERMDIDTDPPTLDLRALSLSQVPGHSRTPTPSSVFSFHHKTTSRPHSPPPPPPPPPPPSSPPRPAAAEDDEIEDLYGPPLGLPSVHAPPPLPPREPLLPSLQPLAPAPVAAGPRLLPALAAEDPRMLATLERHERREAERPRQGMRKPQAVQRAGTRRGGFVLFADHRTASTDACREPRGVFASYFTRSKA